MKHDKIVRVDLVFENCEVLKLYPDMFKGLVINGIRDDILINCFQYKNGEILRSKSCDYVSISIKIG